MPPIYFAAELGFNPPFNPLHPNFTHPAYTPRALLIQAQAHASTRKLAKEQVHGPWTHTLAASEDAASDWPLVTI